MDEFIWLDPRSPNLPNGWRSPLDELRKLKELAQSAGIDTRNWRVHIPANKLARFRGKPWELTYQPPGKDQIETVSLGVDATNSAHVLSGLTRGYRYWIGTLPGGRYQKKIAAPRQPLDIREDYTALRAYQRALKSKDFSRVPYGVIQARNKRAGILHMTMDQYLRTKMGELNPIPPITVDEFQQREREVQSKYGITEDYGV